MRCKSILIFGFAILVYSCTNPSSSTVQGDLVEQRVEEKTSLSTIQHLYETRAEEVQVLVEGEVIKILPDDNEGSRHQKFIIELEGEHTILVALNIDLAPRVSGLKKGDFVEIYGQYEWNKNGGVIHWTHHDPAQEHVDGWIVFNGEKFQ